MIHQQKLYRSNTDRIIAGVCGGLGKFFQIDPFVIRILFVIFAFMGGGGVLLYLILTIIIPKEPLASLDPHAPSSNDFATDAKETMENARHNIRRNFEDFQSRAHGWTLFLGVVLILLGLITLFRNLFPGLIILPSARIFWPLILIAIGLFVILRRR